MAIPFPTPNLRSTPSAARPAPDLRETLRHRLASELHTGKLRPGDRLPSIRQVARETGVDHRAVADAYRALQDEGLVEVLGRSGVRVARPPAAGEAPGAPDGSHWLARLVAEGWMRSVSTDELLRRLGAGAAGAGLRCACLESDEGRMAAYCAEIGALSGMTMEPVHLPFRVQAGERERLRKALGRADVVVTTPFHAAVAWSLLGEGGPPLVVLRVHPESGERLRAPLPILARESVHELSEVVVRLNLARAAPQG